MVYRYVHNNSATIGSKCGFPGGKCETPVKYIFIRRCTSIVDLIFGKDYAVIKSCEEHYTTAKETLEIIHVEDFDPEIHTDSMRWFQGFLEKEGL